MNRRAFLRAGGVISVAAISEKISAGFFPPAEAADPKPTRLDVSARNRVTDTGIDVPAGKSAYITSLPGQSWLTHPHGAGGRCGVSGNGISVNNNHEYTAFNGDEGCMWGYCKASETITVYWFPHGNDGATLQVPGPGRLFLGPNDNNHTDNNFDITVDVVVR